MFNENLTTCPFGRQNPDNLVYLNVRRVAQSGNAPETPS